MVEVVFDSELGDIERMLLKLPKEVLGKNGGPIRSALTRAAKITIAEEVKRNIKARGLVDSGFLHDSVRVDYMSRFLRRARELGGTRYRGVELVRVRPDAWYWHFHELGAPAKNIPARPFLGPAVHTKGPAFVEEFKSVIKKRIQTATRKIARERKR